ncbi:MAG TPA: hypothetical protein PKE69_11085 [Pyrinomonadaceae bacterium]|nr:hypothetical protein [Pyrinomonadaceae bacterium]
MLLKNSNLFRFLFLLAIIFLSFNLAFAQNKENSVAEKTESSISGTIEIEGKKMMPQTFGFSLLKAETSERIRSNSSFSENAEQSAMQNFYIGKLKGGKYRIIFADKNIYVKYVSIGGIVFSGETFVEIKTGEQLKDVHITLASDFGTVTGKVVNFDGTPRAIVVLMKEETEVNQLQARAFSGMIKPNGEFSIKAVPGEYKIYVYLPENYTEDTAKFKEWLKRILENASKVFVNAEREISVSLNMPNK